MMFKEAKKLSRKYLANVHQDTPLYERLKQNKSIDLRNNSVTIEHDNGYDQIKPINANKRIE